ncbi:N-acetylmuramoyl-L-alanine amidase [Kriegella sp. EG-1]|nr:N-acetylmuramoyl-L-alanine amidase [Flavobacteriaceae bacterium EG-1]
MFKNRFFPLSLLLFILFIVPFNQSYSGLLAQDPFVVVMDAGHGGHDPGNLGNGYLEKNIALNIVLRAGRILEQNPDIKVVYTRKDDTFIDLFVRGEIANKAKADLFVSVHCDSHTSDAHGAGTFVLGLHANEQNFAIAKKENSVIYLEDNYATRYADYDINSPESVIGLTIMQEEFLDQSVALAKAIQDNFANKLKRKNRKVKQAGFIVLHQTFMPSVLVETGFLTNDAEGAYLNSSKGQSEMGAAIAEAILTYKKNTAGNVGSNSITNMPSAPDPEMNETVVSKTPSTPTENTVSNSVDSSVNDVAEGIKEETAVVQNVPAKAEDEVKKMLDDAQKKSVEAISVAEVETPAVTEPPKINNEIGKEKTEVIVTEVNDAGKPKIVKEEVITVVKKEVEPTNTAITEKKEIVDAAKTGAEAPNEITKKSESNIEFRVQLMASGKDLLPNDPIFKGLGEITKEPVRSLFRYMHGSTNDVIKARLLKKVADAKGFTTSFLVAYKNGVRMDIDEALKSASE